ncbi:MAG: hypothetical protein CW338_01280 [Clostridiales bacterium]|nr:hypothetical protein [Clostridiales bacterium]
MRKAVISIGSNSTRLLVADCGEELKNRYLGRAETRLFMGLDERGELGEEAMERTVRALCAMRLEAEIQGAESFTLLATSATRDASNADDFAQRILDRAGMKLQIIPGEVEAGFAFRAAAGMEDCVVMDIGGGSTEYSRGNAGVQQFARSTQMGASRLLKLQDIFDERSAAKALELAREALLPAANALNRLPRAERLVGMGGTCTTAASIEQGYFYSGDDVEGVTVTIDTAREQLDMLAPLSPEDRMSVPGLPASRVRHMPHGLCILIASMELLGFDTLTVTGRTILDGYLMMNPD